jgi:hypothetical protein
MTTPPEGAQLSDGGHYWWDGGDWQPVDHAAVAAASGAAPAGAETPPAGAGSGSGSGTEAPPEPRFVVLSGESKFTDPTYLGETIVYEWDETNVGGPITEPYRAKVEVKKDNDVIETKWVDCSPLGTNEAAHRTTELASTPETGSYAIELLVDADHSTLHDEHTWTHNEIVVENKP